MFLYIKTIYIRQISLLVLYLNCFTFYKDVKLPRLQDLDRKQYERSWPIGCCRKQSSYWSVSYGFASNPRLFKHTCYSAIIETRRPLSVFTNRSILAVIYCDLNIYNTRNELYCDPETSMNFVLIYII